jgi:hypothetical protein
MVIALWIFQTLPYLLRTGWHAPSHGNICADSGLFFGTGCHRERFFSGLIDDVRIYNAALTAEEIGTLSL